LRFPLKRQLDAADEPLLLARKAAKVLAVMSSLDRTAV
jgi:hypothetical protein